MEYYAAFDKNVLVGSHINAILLNEKDNIKIICMVP